MIRERLTYLSPVKMLALERAVQTADAREVPGAIVEFGVALGGSAIALTHAGTEREFHGFDLFGTIPPPDGDKDGKRALERYDVIASGESKGIRGDDYYGYVPDLLGRVGESMARHGKPVNGTTVVLHAGLFEDSWPTAAPKITSIAVAHIDCDWFSSVAYCLQEVAMRMSPGGVIVLDDYFDYEGCQKATDQFLASHPEFAVHHRGESLIAQRA